MGPHTHDNKWHSTEGKAYHICPDCKSYNKILCKNKREGKGGKTQCKRCREQTDCKNPQRVGPSETTTSRLDFRTEIG